MRRAILNEQWLNGYVVNSNLPIGAPMAWLSEVPPVGFLAFDGSEYNISDYPELYNVVKNVPSFHSNTEGKFKIPNLKGRVLQGADTVIGELIEAGLPNLIGQVGVSGQAPYSDGELFITIPGQKAMSGNSYLAPDSRFEFNANKYNSIYGNSDTVQPPAFTVRWIIKATQYSTVEQNAIDDTRFTTGNVLSAAKVVEMNSYSTEEIKTEYRWVDNKPIYRKVFSDLNNSWSAHNNIIGNITNFKEPISIKAIAFNDMRVSGWVENNESGDSRCYAYIKSNGEVHFYRNDVRDGTSYPKKVIIEYTKTTD